MGLDGEDDENLYKKILLEQEKAQKIKDAKAKGEHLDDLVDKELIDLLNVCRRLYCPKLEELQSKFVNFGPIP
jgi:hypothetical protein